MNADSAMTFDPYSAWLGLPHGPRPPDPYSLLGVPPFERDRARIVAAAAERVRLVNRKAPFDRGEEMREVLEEISAAERLLADPARRRQAEIGLRSAEKTRPAPASRAAQSSKTTHDATAPAKSPHPTRPAAGRSGGRFRQAGVISGAVVAATLSAAAVWIAWPRSDEVAERPPGTVVAQDPKGLDVRKAIERPDAPRPPGAEPRLPVEAVRPAVTEIAAAAQPSEPPAPTEPVGFAAPVLAPVEAAKPAFDSIVDYRPPHFDSDTDREAYARHVGNLLYEAFELKGNAAALAGHFREADTLAPGAPFTAYAAALASWKRLKFAEAEGHLRTAQGTAADPFLPARRAAIRFDLNRNRRAEALARIVEFASELGARQEVEQGDSTEASIRWLGRLVAALGSPWLPDAAPPKDLADADAAIRGALGPEALAAYEAGRRSLLADYAARAAAVEAEIAKLAVALEAERAETLSEITVNRDEAEGQREEAARSASEWKDWLDQETKGLDEELKQLEVANQQLTVQAEAAAATHLALSAEITRQQAQADARSRAPAALSVPPQTIVAANQALAEWKVLNSRLAEVQGRARVLLAKRQAVVAKYERETNTLAAKTDALRKWENVLKRRAEETGAEEAADMPAAKALRRRLRDFDTYLPFDLDAERAAVLRALRENR